MLSEISTVAVVSAATLAESDVTTGVVPLTVNDTVEKFDSLPAESSTLNVIDATPEKPLAGSKLSWPAASTVHTPSAVVMVF